MYINELKRKFNNSNFIKEKKIFQIGKLIKKLNKFAKIYV